MIIETKFNVGDVAWYIKDDKVQSNEITGIKVSYTLARSVGVHIEYIGYGTFTKKEHEIFGTKQELLDSL